MPTPASSSTFPFNTFKENQQVLVRKRRDLLGFMKLERKKCPFGEDFDAAGNCVRKFNFRRNIYKKRSN